MFKNNKINDILYCLENVFNIKDKKVFSNPFIIILSYKYYYECISMYITLIIQIWPDTDGGRLTIVLLVLRHISVIINYLLMIIIIIILNACDKLLHLKNDFE